MFQKFDEESQKVLKISKKEMQEMKHEYVGTEHLMLGILKTNNSVSKLLDKYNVNYDEFKKSLLKIVGTGKSSNNLFLYTPLLKKVIENAIIDCKDNGVVGVTNLFNSLLEEGDGVAIRTLMSMKVDIDKIYNTFSKSNFKRKNNSKNLLLEELGTNLNKKAKDGLIDPVIGREKEINRMIEILCRRTKNNPILIGDAGVGKTAIVEHLASRIENKDVPNILKNKKIISLDMASSVAGTKYRGEFEDRMKKILNELEENDDIILFIDEIHTIIKAGGAEGAIDASNIFKPALARGKMRCIGATTIDEYKKYIENDGALDRRFQKLEIKQPDEKTVKQILMKLKKIYESHHGVAISEKMIDKIILYTNRYIKDRNEPDRSIDILDEVCSRTSLKTNLDDDKLKKLKQSLKEIVDNKNKFIIENDFKKAYKLKQEEDSISSTINNIELKKNNKIKLVTEKDIIEVIKSKTNMPIIELNDKYIEEMKEELNSNIVGQKEAIEELLLLGKRINSNFNNSCVSILLCGKSGVGKTLLAKTYAKLLVGKNNIIKLNMSEFTESHSISKIVGAPPGYVGYQDTKNVLDEIKNKPNCILILDEIEKCSKNVLNLFIKAIDEGELKDSKGRIVHFENITIIMTSNINIDNNSLGFNSKDCNVKNKLKYTLGENVIDKFTKIIVLNPMTEEVIKNIILKKAKQIGKKYNTSIQLSENFINDLIKESEYNTSGARKISELVRYNVENYVVDEVINGNNKISIDSLNLVSN